MALFREQLEAGVGVGVFKYLSGIGTEVFYSRGAMGNKQAIGWKRVIVVVVTRIFRTALRRRAACSHGCCA